MKVAEEDFNIGKHVSQNKHALFTFFLSSSWMDFGRTSWLGSNEFLNNRSVLCHCALIGVLEKQSQCCLKMAKKMRTYCIQRLWGWMRVKETETNLDPPHPQPQPRGLTGSELLPVLCCGNLGPFFPLPVALLLLFLPKLRSSPFAMRNRK